MKKVISTSLLLALILTDFTFNPSPSLADESVNNISSASFEENVTLNFPEINEKTLINSTDYEIRNNIDYYLNEYKNLQSMSIEELNEYISSIKDEQDGDSLYRAQSVPPDVQLRIAWLAAAEMAKKAGYTAAGTIVQYSVLGVNYSENNGFIADKIKRTTIFRTLLYHVKQTKKPVHRSHIFTKSDSSDLFYTFHEATFTINKNINSNNYYTHLYDYFDFALNKVKYDDLFTTLVNDWAWLNQNAHILKNINIDIYFLTI